MIEELFRLGPIAVSPFGLMMVLAFLSAYFQLRWGFKKSDLGSEDDASAILLAGGIGGILGAKIYYAILYGDWRFGNLWALEYDPAQKKTVANHLIEKPADVKEPTVQPTAFCPDENGEALVLGWRGKIFRIVPGA